MKKIFPLLFVVLATQQLMSQTLTPYWTTQSNNAAVTNSNDQPKFVKVDGTGKVAIAGESNGKVILAAYDGNGNDLWTNKYNPPVSESCIGLDMDTSGNYYVGYFWGGTIRKVDPSGTNVWTQAGTAYHGRCFALDKNNGIVYNIGTDYPTDTIYIEKIGSGGNLLWTKKYAGVAGKGGIPKKAFLDGNGKLIIAFDSRDVSGNLHPAVAKFDPSSTASTVWQYAYTALNGKVNDIYVDQTTNASYLTGYVDNGGNQRDMIAVKVGSGGSQIWVDTYHDFMANSNDEGFSITKDNTGAFFVAMTTGNAVYAFRKYSSAGAILATNSILSFYNKAGGNLIQNPLNHQLYLAGSDLGAGYQMALYKMDQGLNTISKIYTFDYSASNTDFGVDVHFDPQGNVIFTGDIYSVLNDHDYYYSKTDSLGNFIYGNIYNGFTNSWDESGDIITDANNYPVVAGSTLSTLTGYDGVLVKYDAAGNEQFFLTYDGADHLDDKLIAIDTTSAGQYYAGGYSKSMASGNDMWVIKTDQNGSVLWNKLLTGTASGEDKVTDVQADDFNNAYVSGFQTNNGTGKDASFIKLNSSGTVLWSKKYSGPGNNADAFSCFVRSNSGIFYAAGYTTNSAGNKDVLVCRYSSSGNLTWSATYDTPLNGNDSAIAVAVDASDNVYITGQSNAMPVFTIKFSSAGTLSWVTPEPNMASVGSSIRVNGSGQVYISCRMDTLTYDVLKVICYNNNGSMKWSRNFDHSCCEEPAKLRKTNRGTILALFDAFTTVSIAELDTAGNVLNDVTYNPPFGLNNTGGANAITLDKNYDVYFTSWFTVESGSDIVTGKLCYTPGVSVITGTDSVCYSGNASYMVNPISGVTQYTWASPSGSSVVSGTNTNAISVDFGTSSGGYIVVSKTNYCGTDDGDTLMINVLPLPAVNAGPDQLVCPGATVTLNGNGAQSYSWNNGVSNGVSFNATVAQNYVVTGTDVNSCSNKDTVNISLNIPALAELCLVTVDSLSTHNILAWDKTALTGVSYFNIYREDITNNYTLIGAVPYDSLSEYHDYDAAANPNITTKRYKISAVDTCGNEGLKSNFHNTIFVTNNNGSFTWNTYTIQNSSNPVQFYALYRDDNNNGNWNQIGTTAGTQNILSDPNYSGYPNGAWRIETIWNISCTPTRGAINTSRSNIKISSVTGIQDFSSISMNIYPNPFSNQFTLDVSADRNGAYTLEITNALGQVISVTQVTASKTLISTETWANGVYFYKLYNSHSIKAGKITKD